MRTAPGDRRLSDAEWTAVIDDVLTSTGYATAADDGGCRWLAVRHADDHVHLVVTLARQDGRRASTSNDFYRLGETLRRAEVHYGLTVTAPRDRTALTRPTRAETEKTARTGRREAASVILRREVTAAAVGAGTPEEFFGRLRAAGVMVRPRMSERNPGEITGYAVAWPDLRTADGRPVWFSGSKLAADLSWSKLAHHWNHPTTTGDGWGDIRRAATHATRHLTRHPTAGADVAAATGDTLAAIARSVDGPFGRGALTDTAACYRRAAGEPWRHTPAPTHPGSQLRTAARAIARAGRTTGAAQVLDTVAAVAVLLDAVATWRHTQGRNAQATVAHAAATQLRDAYTPGVPSPVARNAHAVRARPISGTQP